MGKPCTFEIEEGTQTRTFGHINVGGENLANKIVAAGWAKVKPMGSNASASKGAYIEELLQVCRSFCTCGFVWLGAWESVGCVCWCCSNLAPDS